MNRNGTGTRLPIPQPVPGKIDPSPMQKEFVRL